MCNVLNFHLLFESIFSASWVPIFFHETPRVCVYVCVCVTLISIFSIISAWCWQSNVINEPYFGGWYLYNFIPSIKIVNFGDGGSYYCCTTHHYHWLVGGKLWRSQQAPYSGHPMTWAGCYYNYYHSHDGSMVLVYMLTLGAYWWDPCYHI